MKAAPEITAANNGAWIPIRLLIRGAMAMDTAAATISAIHEAMITFMHLARKELSTRESSYELRTRLITTRSMTTTTVAPPT
jgi:hypothetical protein